MPPAPNGHDFSPQLESHEDRLQRVETNLAGVTTSVARIEVQTDHIVAQLTQGLDDIKAHNEKVMARLDQHADDIQAQDARLKPVEAHLKEDKAAGKKTRDRIKGAILAILVAGGGAVATKLAEGLFAGK